MARKVWIVAALVAVVSTMGLAIVGVASRTAGLNRLRSVLEEQESRGYGASLDDLVAMAPPGDPRLHEKCWECLQARSGAPCSYNRPLDESWFFAHSEEVNPDDRAWSDRLRPEMERLGALLVEGPVCLTSLGWIRADAERLAASPVSMRHIRLPHLLRLREAHRWFGFEAMVSKNPEAALQVLDALRDALSSPGCLIDAMVVGACSSMRDRAILRLALRGDLSDDRLADWLAEPSDALLWLADAERGERLLYWAPLGQALLAGEGLGDHFEGRGGIGSWVSSADDCASFVEHLATTEAVLRGEIDPDTVPTLGDNYTEHDFTHSAAVINWRSWCTTGTWWRTEHRTPRLGVLLSRAASAHDRVPKTEAEARKWLGEHASMMDAGTWDVALTYTRVSEKRFRLSVDPESPVPAVFKGRPEARQVVETHLRRAPSDPPLDTGLGWIEIAIP